MKTGGKLPRGFDSKAYLRLALPMIISRAGLAAMDIADGVMVSRFQTHEFAWLSLAEAMLGRLLDVFIAFLIGGLALVPRHFSRDDHAGARSFWIRTFPVAIGLGSIGLLAGIFGEPILTLLGQKPDLAAGAAPIMLILGAGYPAALMAIAAAVYLEGINRPHFVAISVATANVLNIALNYLFIGGHLGFSAMGARGSALSTSIVRGALGVALVGYAWRWYRNEKLEPSATHDAERAASKRAQWRLGFSSSITVTAMAILTAPLTLVAGRLGIVSLASFSAAWNMAGPAILVILGLSDASGIYVASEAGYGDLRAAARVAWSALRITFIPISIAAIVLFVWASACASLYTTDAQVRISLTSLLPLAGVLLLVDCVGFIMSSSLRALRDTMWPAGIQITALALLVPLTFHFAWYGGYGVRGLYIAMLLSSVFRVSLLIWRFMDRTKLSSARPDAPIENQWSLNAK